MTPSQSCRRWPALVAATVSVVLAASAFAQDRGRGARPGDYIVAVVNQELVTAFELTQRMQLAGEAATRGGARAPGEDELRRQMLDALIEERAIISYARDSGLRIDDAELDRALQALAAQNRLTLEQLRERLRAEGTDFARFRIGVREQMMVERIREREVYQRIRVSDAEIEQWIAAQRAQAANDAELNLAQILVTVPEGASDAVVAERRARAEAALARVRAGESFEAVARALSEDGNRERGGEIGLRPANRLPDLFVEAVRSLAAGQVSSAPLRSPAGFHVLKVLERREAAALRVPQTRVRHILLRTSQQLGAEEAGRRLAAVRREIDAGTRRFEDVAREISEDGSSASGGDLGWAAPGMMVPEFEAAMDALEVGGLSQPVVSRFGVHLLQVLERREVAIDERALREQARSVLRERKFEQAYRDWASELRARAYVELREPPQ